jgi:hypothetical protein
MRMLKTVPRVARWHSFAVDGATCVAQFGGDYRPGVLNPDSEVADTLAVGQASSLSSCYGEPLELTDKFQGNMKNSAGQTRNWTGKMPVPLLWPAANFGIRIENNSAGQ